MALTRKEYACSRCWSGTPAAWSPSRSCCARSGVPATQQDTHYLRILIGKLRQKLGDDAAAPRWIDTEPGVGLRLREDEQEASSSSL